MALYHLTRARLLDGGWVGRRIHGSLGSGNGGFSKSRRALSVNGHEERSTLHSSSGRYRFGNETSAERRRIGRDAPIPADRGATIEPLESTLNQPWCPCR